MKALKLLFVGLLMANSVFGIVGKEGAPQTQLVQNEQVTLADRLAATDALVMSEPQAKPTFAQKMAAKFLSKKMAKKLDKALGGAAAGGSGDTAALLSLIFGAAGLGLMWVLGILGLLLGLAGFILGLYALKRTESKRTMAILGTVFGGICVLLVLLVIVLIGVLLSAG